ncbi:hypothetical protein OROMI_026383 [Orobanche minor]
MAFTKLMQKAEMSGVSCFLFWPNDSLRGSQMSVRLLEVAIVKQWSKKGLMPITHELFSDPVNCVKDVPL